MLAARDEQIAGLKWELEEARKELLTAAPNDAWKTVVKLAYAEGGEGARNIQMITTEYVQMKKRAETAEARVKELEQDWIKLEQFYISRGNRIGSLQLTVAELISAAEPFIEDVEYLDGIADDCECDISVWVGSAITPHREKVFPKDWARLRTISVWVGELRALAAAVQKARQENNK